MVRKSNLELLRILAMLAIVSGHLLSQSGLADVTGTNHVLAILLGSGVRIGVNVFLILGVWFMVDAPFKAERIVRLYLEVVFYSIPITTCMLLMGEAGGIRNVLQGLFPFFGRSVWFASAYISLIAIAPFLNHFFTLPLQRQRTFLVVLILLFCIVPTIPCSTPLDYLADFTWFCVVYLAVGMIKRGNMLERLRGAKRFLLAGCTVYLALVGARLVPATQPIAEYWIVNIKSLPNVLCAFLIFLGFLRLDFGVVQWINRAARSVFAVYIVHQTPAFIHYQWNVLCRADLLADTPPVMFAGCVAGISLAVFLVVSAVDFMRLRLLEPYYMASLPVKWICFRIAAYERPGEHASERIKESKG